MKTELL